MAIGCIGEEFDLDGKQLVLLGPVRAQRPPGAPSGLYSDSAGMRVQSAPELTERVSQDGPSTTPVKVPAWGSVLLPATPVQIVNPYTDRPYMVAGHWSVQWQTRTDTNHKNGHVQLVAEPARYAFTDPDSAFGFRHGTLPGVQSWGGSGVWPVCEVLAPGERITLYVNAYVSNQTAVEVQLDYRNVLFSGVQGPAASGHAVPTLAQVASRETGKTLGAIATAHTGRTLAALVEEWST